MSGMAAGCGGGGGESESSTMDVMCIQHKNEKVAGLLVKVRKSLYVGVLC